MSTCIPGRWSAVLVLGLVTAGCSQSSHSTQTPAPQPAASSTQPHASYSTAAAAEADSVRKTYTPADVNFMTHMISHHAQAIEMAGWAPSHGASPSVQRLAERIINAQQDEIATMQAWLGARHLPVPDPDPAGMKMQMGGSQHVMLMPGMLTPDQMTQLDAARGPDFDRLFLTFMIQHHNGALTMVHQLFDTPGAAQEGVVFKFASDVNVDQTTEVARMQRMLTAMSIETPSSQ
jgi:uncharacterized protein (DUF305 family)